MPAGGGLSFSPMSGPNRTYYSLKSDPMRSNVLEKASYKSEEEHAESLHHSAPHEGQAATQRIGKEEHKDQTGHDLDNTVDPLSKERRRRAGKSKVAEDHRGVVVNRTRLRTCQLSAQSKGKQ